MKLFLLLVLLFTEAAYAAGWVYFKACGFESKELIEDVLEGALTIPAPNIRGYWVRKDYVIGVIDWRGSKGIPCSSVYVIGADKPVHVIGSTGEVIKKLRY